ncbi:hypothetical protein DL546_009175 [Coniochaeta pulveracea]|uniref:Major facilitator superfamily (MFS) profile domain-containing protein n=1 Tax=Coniochaeta pulveracea TaxID=177199 RepID=A0A420YNU6_9PEZI|nr:hypothetical protein DL546_009175 [Coniochaeta pulveracea]
MTTNTDQAPLGANDYRSPTHGANKNDIVDEAEKLGVTVEEIAVVRVTEEDLMKISAECFSFRSKAGLRMVGVMLVMACNQAGFGVDWGVIGGINSMPLWHSYFGFGNSGSTLGTINALMMIGSFCGAPFLGLSDVLGRRGVNFLGNAIVIVGALLQGLAPNIACFMVGRFVLGFGTSLMAAPQYMAEVAPVHMRGRLVGIFGACFTIGSMLMSGLMMIFTKMDSNWQWRGPLLLAGIFPLCVCSLIYVLCPESPRYDVIKGRPDKARRTIAKFMTTNNDIHAPIVDLMIAEIETSLETSRAGAIRIWDWRPFFTRAAGYRTLLIVVYSCFQQWNGGGVIGYYLSPALDTVGITDSMSQLGIQLGQTATGFVFTLVGAFILCQTAATITSWQYAERNSSGTAILTVFWFFLYQIFSASLITTMHNLYPVEFLSLTLRAKGMGMYSMVQGAAGVVQSYGISVGINKIGYKIWVVYIVYNSLQLIVAYFLFPETSKLTLEEIDTIFETPGVNPVKMSLKIEKARKEREAAERDEALGHGA